MIYEAHMDDCCVCKITNVPLSPKPQCGRLKHRMKNTAIIMVYNAKESFCRGVKVKIR